MVGGKKNVRAENGQMCHKNVSSEHDIGIA